MIAKCANPACRSRFDHRVGGKFFRFHLPEPAQPDASAPVHNTHNVVHYWLCPVCSRIFSLACDDHGKVVLRLVEQEFIAAPPQHAFTAA
jgi:hypothetical protein